MERQKLTKKIITVAVVIAVVFFIGKKIITMLTFKPPQMPTTTVTVAKPQVKAVAEEYEFTGSAMAVEDIKIRARVSGYLQKVHFQEGANIKQGDLLFEIEPDIYQAKYDQALATLNAAEAEFSRADTDFKRVEEAVKTNAVSKQELTTKKAQRDQAQAAVMSAKAMLSEAALHLGYTKIYSPIDGRISRKFADVGNLVGAGEFTVLAEIMKLEPIYVYFHISEKFMLENFADSNTADSNQLEFYVGLENSIGYPYKGRITYFDNKVDSNTGTIYVRGEIANKDEKILPGMFVRIKVPVGINNNSMLINEIALGTDISGKYLMIVNKDNTVEHRPVEIGQAIDGLRVIKSGLSVDDIYIVSGLQFVYPGAQVNTIFEGQRPTENAKPAN